MSSDWLAVFCKELEDEDEDEGAVSCAGMKIPWVASEACWRKTVEFECVGVVEDEDEDEDAEAEGKGS